MGGGHYLAAGEAMADANQERVEAVRRQMEGRGYLVRLTTAREGERLVGRIHIVEAKTERTVAKIVAAAKVEDLDVVLGVDAEEGLIRDVLAQAMSAADALREALPTITIREERPVKRDG